MKIERTISDIENRLTSASKIPILGTIPAIVQVVLGILQSTIAILFTLFLSPFALCSDNAKVLCCQSAKHIVHGLGNIFVGIAQAIPILGTLIVSARPSHSCIKGSPLICGQARMENNRYVELDANDPINNKPPIALHYFSAQSGKFLAYSELIQDSTVYIWNYQEYKACSACKQGSAHHHTHRLNMTHNDAQAAGLTFFINERTSHWYEL